MGRFRNKKKVKRDDVYQQDRDRAQATQTHSYKEIKKENENFEIYYKTQKLVPDSDWPTLMQCLRDPLPASFRINTFCPNQARILRSMVEGSHFKDLLTMQIESKIDSSEVPGIDSVQIGVNDQGETKCTKPAIQPLEWYPDRMAWQMNYTRVDIRKSPILSELHKFLIVETDTGHLSRQESVSMIPPLLMDVQSGQNILDMCAAPGSKTAQLIEYMLNSKVKKATVEAGIVIANDVDNKRCYMLVHQSGRLNAPNCAIINQDAAKMPVLYTGTGDNRSELKFDRILCDVPCSGDGTIRKNIDVWNKWNVQNSHGLHRMQIKIARRGLELLKKDGLMVYSTCSLSPSEDESVVSELLRISNGCVELVSVSDKLKGLRYMPGLSVWTLFDKNMRIVERFEDVPAEYATQMNRSLFPPTSNESTRFNLHRCIRLLPHLQNTGGFFVAVFRKLSDKLPWEDQRQQGQAEKGAFNEEQRPQNQQDIPRKKPKRMQGFKENPFIFLTEDDEDWQNIKTAFGIDNSFPADQLLHRCAEGRKRNIYIVSQAGKDFIQANDNRDGVVKLITCGMRIFSRANTKTDTDFRMCQDGIGVLLPFVDKKLCIDCNRTDLELLLSTRYIGIERFSEETRESLRQLRYGSFIFIYKHKFCQSETEKNFEIIDTPLIGWRGEYTAALYVSDNYRIHLAGLLGIELPPADSSKKQQKSPSNEADKELSGPADDAIDAV